MLDLVSRSVAAARVGSCKPSADLCMHVVCLMPRFILCRMQKCVDKGKEINIQGAVSKDTITRGLRYAVATGNWGQQGTADLRAGVSQVPTMLACPACNWLRTRNILQVLPQKAREVLHTNCTTVTSHVTATLAVWAGAEPAGVCEHAVAPAAH